MTPYQTGEIADVEFRFAVPKSTTTKTPQLQYRKFVSFDHWSCQWTEWVKVPFVVVNDEEVQP